MLLGKRFQVFSLLAVLDFCLWDKQPQGYDLLLPRLRNGFTKAIGTKGRSKFDKKLKNTCNWLQNYYFLGVTELYRSFSARILEIRSVEFAIPG